MKGAVLHVVPDSVLNTKKAFVGSTKDIRGRTEYFEDRGLAYHQHIAVDRSDEMFLRWLQQNDLGGFAAVIFEYESYIKSLSYLREAHPHIRRIVRSHNANLPHQLDNFFGHVRMGESQKAAADIDEALVRFQQDRTCAELADFILPICEWEAQHYWSKLSPTARVLTTPYFLPKTFAVPPPAIEKSRLVVCFMGTGGKMTPLLYDAARNVIDLVEQAGAQLDGWDFVITGSIKPKGVLGALGPFKPTGLIESPYDLLRKARVVTLLSDLGMGFKTKILEAAMAGCWVLVTPDVWERLPEAVRPWCKAIPIDAPLAFADAMCACESPPPSGDPNAPLRAAAFRALDRALEG